MPYYEQDGITIYHGDCREVIHALPEESADLLITDPPYGMKWQSGLRSLAFGMISGDDGLLPVTHIIDESLRVLRNCRHCYVFGRFNWDGTRLRQPVELIWDKGQIGPGDLALPWGPSHEAITFAVYVKSEKNTRDNYGRLSARLRRGSVLRVPRLNASAVAMHPTEKPVALLRQLIESSSMLGETVFDPFAGCGSTLVAARIEGRKAIGIELEEKYCEIAAKRLAQGALDLFGETSHGNSRLVLSPMPIDSENKSATSELSATVSLSYSHSSENANARALVEIAEAIGWPHDAPAIEPWQVVQDIKRLVGKNQSANPDEDKATA